MNSTTFRCCCRMDVTAAFLPLNHKVSDLKEVIKINDPVHKSLVTVGKPSAVLLC